LKGGILPVKIIYATIRFFTEDIFDRFIAKHTTIIIVKIIQESDQNVGKSNKNLKFAAFIVTNFLQRYPVKTSFNKAFPNQLVYLLI
jgi:hypothetical protein